jgi:hypothetical protein
MISIDLPPKLQERVLCSIMAAMKYEVPANIILAVAEKEGGNPNEWVKNSNGTFDVGSMQFNTTYLKDLKKYGITAEDVAQPGCYSYDLAAWRLRGHLRNDSNDLWTRAANYHSRTPKYNQIYRKDLIIKAMKWGHWLELRFPTYSISKPGSAPVQTIHTPTAHQQEKNKFIKQDVDNAHQQALYALDAFYTSSPMRGFS